MTTPVTSDEPAMPGFPGYATPLPALSIPVGSRPPGGFAADVFIVTRAIAGTQAGTVIFGAFLAHQAAAWFAAEIIERAWKGELSEASRGDVICIETWNTDHLSSVATFRVPDGPIVNSSKLTSLLIEHVNAVKGA